MPAKAGIQSLFSTFWEEFSTKLKRTNSLIPRAMPNFLKNALPGHLKHCRRFTPDFAEIIKNF